jgi:hypothetical protein
MTEPDWSRPDWSRDAANALLVYFVFGAFAAQPGLDRAMDGGHGLPAGITLQRFSKAALAHWAGHPLHGDLGAVLKQADPEAFAAARQAPECLLLRGEVPDRRSLAYLRDTLDVIGALLKAGGVAVVDPQILEILSAEAWRVHYAGAARAAARGHVLILCDQEGDGRAWIRSRGMRKFARPDISIRHVPQADARSAGAIAARLVELQVNGMRFGDGSTVDVDAIPGGLRVTRRGSPDDPVFNNTHLEITWP